MIGTINKLLKFFFVIEEYLKPISSIEQRNQLMLITLRHKDYPIEQSYITITLYFTHNSLQERHEKFYSENKNFLRYKEVRKGGVTYSYHPNMITRRDNDIKFPLSLFLHFNVHYKILTE